MENFWYGTGVLGLVGLFSFIFFIYKRKSVENFLISMKKEDKGRFIEINHRNIFEIINFKIIYNIHGEKEKITISKKAEDGFVDDILVLFGNHGFDDESEILIYSDVKIKNIRFFTDKEVKGV